MTWEMPNRFMSKVVIDDAGCWLWCASLNRGGYGQYSHMGKLRRAHRYSYEVAHGPIPDGLTLDHLCRVRRCVNPDHLRPCTLVENIHAPGCQIGETNRRKTACPQGHAFDASNTYLTPNGRRNCKECRRAAHRRWKQRRSQERRAA